MVQNPLVPTSLPTPAALPGAAPLSLGLLWPLQLYTLLSLTFQISDTMVSSIEKWKFKYVTVDP